MSSRRRIARDARTDALTLERQAERSGDPGDWLVAGDAWEELGDKPRAWFAHLQGRHPTFHIPSAEAESIRDRIERYEDARRRFDPRRFARGGGRLFTEEVQMEILRLAGLTPEEAPTNDDRGALEHYLFVREQPPSVFAYYDDAQNVTTFNGDVLGEITAWGRERRAYGTRLRHGTVRAVNGYTYSGWCNLETGSYCRLRRGKPWLTWRGPR